MRTARVHRHCSVDTSKAVPMRRITATRMGPSSCYEKVRHNYFLDRGGYRNLELSEAAKEWREDVSICTGRRFW